jgi:hypothetical protein
VRDHLSTFLGLAFIFLIIFVNANFFKNYMLEMLKLQRDKKNTKIGETLNLFALGQSTIVE